MKLRVQSESRSQPARASASVAARGRSRTSHGAFTVIEMLGIMAVMAILALALMPLFMRQLQRAARERERNTLRRMSEGYQQITLNTHTILPATNWVTPVAKQIGMLVTEVMTNYVGNARALVVDPALRVGTNTPYTLPYVQTIRGVTNRPASPRMIFIGSLDKPLPGFLSGSGPAPAGYFEALWNSREDTPPTFWASVSTANWLDIKIARLTLEPLFIPVTLNYESPLQQGRYSLDDTNCAASTNLPPARPFTTYLLSGTRLCLFSHGSASAAPLQITEAIFDTRSYIYHNGAWRSKLYSSYGSRRLNGEDLQEAYEKFTMAMPNSGARAGRTQVEVTTSMMQFMLDYIEWANSDFTGSSSAVDSSQRVMESHTFDFTRHPPTL